jgi:hypothetical protein
MNLNDGSVEKINSYGIRPVGRFVASMWFSKDTKCLYLFGGLLNDTSGFDTAASGYANDLWEYNLTTGIWNLLGPPHTTEVFSLPVGIF